MTDLSRAVRTPYAHQVVGVEALVKWDDPSTGRIYPGCFALFDEMGAGKTKQVIDTAQILFEAQLHGIDRVVVVAPNAVRRVWVDTETGELIRHLWEHSEHVVTEYHGKSRQWQTFTEPSTRYLHWIVTNYEFIRNKTRLQELFAFCTPRTWLIADESIAVKNAQAQQTKACFELRKRCGRVTLLNGTPIGNDLGDLFAQANLMDPRILDCRTYSQYKARYAIMGGWQNKQVLQWSDWGIADVQRRMAPYVLRRLKEDCLDLPAKLPPVVIPVPLTPKVWDLYVSMRDELMSWLSASTASLAPQAITKVMRLAQITSGFLGGVETLALSDDPRALDLLFEGIVTVETPKGSITTEEVGREKLDAFFDFLDLRLEEDPHFKLIVFMCFSPELRRAVKETRARYPHIDVGVFAGGHTKEDRQYATRLLHPDTAPIGPAVVFGNEKSGGVGQNFTAASTMLRFSRTTSLFYRLQGDDRIHRPGQTKSVSYFDLIATGPKGQKTIDHKVLHALEKKHELAKFTTSAWLDFLADDG